MEKSDFQFSIMCMKFEAEKKTILQQYEVLPDESRGSQMGHRWGMSHSCFQTRSLGVWEMLQKEKSDFYFSYSCMKLRLKKMHLFQLYKVLLGGSYVSQMGGIPSIYLDEVAVGMVDVTVGKFQFLLLQPTDNFFGDLLPYSMHEI